MQKAINNKPRMIGTTQANRLSEALVEGFFHVDEMSFEDLLLLAKEIAEQVHYYDLTHNRVGHWGGLFTAHDVVIMAMMLRLDCSTKMAGFNQCLEIDRYRAVNECIELFIDIDFYINALQKSKSEFANELCLKIISVVDMKLGSELLSIMPLAFSASQQVRTEQNKLKISLEKVNALSAFWPKTLRDKIATCYQATFDPQSTDNTECDGIELYRDDAKTQLYRCFSTLMNSIDYLQLETQVYFQQAIESYRHDPALGLLMAFLKLFGKAQDELNQFTVKHRQFYYCDLLKFEPMSEHCEQAYLVLSLAKGVKRSVLLPKGTVFSSGKDKPFQESLYETNEAIWLTDVLVKQICTLHLQRDPLISPESELHYVTGVRHWQGWGQDGVKESDEVLIGKRQRGFSLFGHGKDPDVIFEQSELGLVVTDPVLLLKEGQRTIEIAVTLVEPDSVPADQLNALSLAGTQKDKQHALMAIFSHLLDVDSDFHDNAFRLDEASLQTLLSEKNIHSLRRSLYKYYLLGLLTSCQSVPLLYRLLGRLFSRHTLSIETSKMDETSIEQCQPWLNETDLLLVKKKVTSLLDGKDLSRLLRLLSQSRLLTFYQLYETMFNIQLSTEVGWRSLQKYQIHPLVNHDEGEYGFRFTLILPPSFPALMPYACQFNGQDWTMPSPGVQLTINPLATFFPYSIFRALLLSSIQFEVDVAGITELVAYNQHGRVDPSKSFHPFGAQASLQSHFIFGSHEMALKNIKHIAMTITWSELPTEKTGFAFHYAQYPDNIVNEHFLVELGWLKEGGWCSDHKRYLLFSASDEDVLRSQSHIIANVNYDSVFEPSRNKKEVFDSASFDYNLKSRGGFFKLTLVSPKMGFGHRDYTPLLTQLLVDNAKTKRHQRPLPNLPYTPIIERFSLNYKASAMIDFSHTQMNMQSLQSVVHIHPFGFERIYPFQTDSSTSPKRVSSQDMRHYLFPRYRADGHLFIGLSGTSLSGVIQLFFHLDSNMDQENSTLSHNTKKESYDERSEPSLTWLYLMNNQWKTLSDKNVLSDSTQGLLTSGIVTLDLPEALNQIHSIMPAGLFWISVVSNNTLSLFSKCYSVSVQGATVTRKLPSTGNLDKGAPQAPIAQGGTISDKWRAIPSIAEMGTIDQKTPVFGGHRKEQQWELVQRASERLRHKGRAISTWDYERLILQAFSHIDKVACLPNIVYPKQGVFPGHLLIVVRPKVTQCHHGRCNAVSLSDVLLKQVTIFVQDLCSAFVQVEVREPEYESLQVRCKVKFTSNMNKGALMAQLNHDICEYLCPWTEANRGQTGLETAVVKNSNLGLGWHVKTKDIDSFIHQLDYVSFVTQLSVLHLVEEQDSLLPYYQLRDSAFDNTAAQNMRQDTSQEASPTIAVLETDIFPSRPWSILMSLEHHMIECIEEEVYLAPSITGIDALTVGENFIIGDDLSSQSCQQQPEESNEVK
ncbi:hypothetical protein [Shewanella surugensis]|uniref:Baseplate protein J-like domain-containing protein n=1 Tax=Shewanella surugensis TaxID=212020 RepID=A0ABT0L9B7_9GAMM|nr:hypothetical protein [Shewanella surugensis]MCL1123741.1 hypothetical protein [Shewanella surugensis]